MLDVHNISRGTTHTLTLTLPPEYDLTNCESLYLTFAQNDKELFSLTKDDVDINLNVIIAKLSQERTLEFNTGRAEMQLRAKLNNGDVITQQPPTKLCIGKIYKDGVI